MTMSHSNPVTTHNRRAVGVFPNRRAAEQALYALRDSGFPMDRVSVITRDEIRESEIAGADVHDSVSEHRAAQHVDNKAEEGAAVGITTGGVLGGLTGLLVGLGSLSSKALRSSKVVLGRKALRTSGRLNAIRATPSHFL